MQVKWKVGSVRLGCPEEEEGEGSTGGGARARAGFRDREGGRETERKGCQRLLVL